MDPRLQDREPSPYTAPTATDLVFCNPDPYYRIIWVHELKFCAKCSCFYGSKKQGSWNTSHWTDEHTGRNPALVAPVPGTRPLKQPLPHTEPQPSSYGDNNTRHVTWNFNSLLATSQYWIGPTRVYMEIIWFLKHPIGFFLRISCLNVGLISSFYYSIPKIDIKMHLDLGLLAAVFKLTAYLVLYLAICLSTTFHHCRHHKSKLTHLFTPSLQSHRVHHTHWVHQKQIGHYYLCGKV